MYDVAIRAATDKDIPMILALLYELGRPKPQNDSDFDTFRKIAKNYANDSDKLVLLAEINHVNIVGMISMMLLPRLNHATLEMYVPELVVLEKYQDHGIGKNLINSCIDFAKKKKCHRIRLESGNQRLASHQFYQHLGFEKSALSFTKSLD